MKRRQTHPFVIEAARCTLAADYKGVLAACEALQQAGHFSPDASFMQGTALYYLGNPEAAIAPIQKALSYQADPEWISMLASVYQALDRIEDGQPLYEQMLTIAPDGLPDTFHRLYTDAVIATRSGFFPFERRKRFASLLSVLETALAHTPADGWIAECGCFRGLSARLIASTVAQHQPEFGGERMIICDSFEGLGHAVPEDAIPKDDPEYATLIRMTAPGYFAAPQELVQKNLANFPAIHFVKGWVPQSLVALPEEAIYRFVNLDVDMFEPTAGALAYFWPRLHSNGIIITDDFNWPGCRKAFNDFYSNLPADSFSLHHSDYGQAWLIKR